MRSSPALCSAACWGRSAGTARPNGAGIDFPAVGGGAVTGNSPPWLLYLAPQNTGGSTSLSPTGSVHMPGSRCPAAGAQLVLSSPTGRAVPPPRVPCLAQSDAHPRVCLEGPWGRGLGGGALGLGGGCGWDTELSVTQGAPNNAGVFLEEAGVWLSLGLSPLAPP